MKPPLIIRDDGTAYRLTLHDVHPKLPILGTAEESFLLYSVESMRLRGQPTAPWLIHEEWRKDPAHHLAEELASYLDKGDGDDITLDRALATRLWRHLLRR